MSKDISVIDTIQSQKEKDIAKRGQPALDPEGIKVAEEKRYTIDIVDAPTDPLR